MIFTIHHIDPLGQGVCKDYPEVTFIPKTLPGETGEMNIIKRHKGVAFAKALTITTPAKERVPPTCPHFAECAGCHYLHTTYQQELQFKVASLNFMLQSLKLSVAPPAVSLIEGKSRLGYRNRLQLHYNLHQKKLGLIGEDKRTILPIPSCKLPLLSIQEKMRELYSDNSWTELVPQRHPPIGHLELYWKEGNVEIFWNQDYASGGFSQVNLEMNQLIAPLFKEKVAEIFPHLSSPTVLDLFGGDGNLSRLLSGNSFIIDQQGGSKSDLPPHQKFYPYDLYHEKTLSSLQQKMKSEYQNKKIDLMLVNPPRSGFKFLNEYVDQFKPEGLFYMSCKASTLIRDLKTILSSGYRIEQIYLIDLFPSTCHFETLAILKR